MLHHLRHLLRRLHRPLRYRWRLVRDQPAGDQVYAMSTEAPPDLAVEARIRSTSGSPEDASAWCARQTLEDLQVVAFTDDGREAWRVDRHGSATARPAPFFIAPQALPELVPAHLESAVLVAAAETVDAVALPAAVLDPRAVEEPWRDTDRAEDLLAPAWRPFLLLRADAFDFDPRGDFHDDLRPRTARFLVKKIVPDRAEDVGANDDRRRGPYFSSGPLPSRLTVGIRDLAAAEARHETSPARARVLVTAPFLARGGAEHTLFETLRVLGNGTLEGELGREFEFVFATLAHHLPELGDRRSDFRALDERLFCLGDLLHPAAMTGILLRLVDDHGIDVLYNANSTTLFYDFAPRLKAARPRLRIVDHLYDHRVGYIERYADPALLECVDACVAENRRIAEVLTSERGWPASRVPVIWPCGRARDAFPTDPAATRKRLREELGVGDEEVLILTAARLHPQKRPLDFVALAELARHLPVRFLLVGGGPLEAELEAALAQAPRIPLTRLPFRQDIPDLIHAADAGCLISEYEGLPVFLLECLQAGRPFLGTDVGDLGHVLRETGAGIVVDQPGDLDALLAAVERLADPQHRATLAECAARAGREFEVEACAARYAAAFCAEQLED